MKRITLEFLGINNYRNCASVTIKPHPVINVFTGLNGAGKTSILDSIYYLCNGRSYFSSQDIYLYREGESFFRIEGKIKKDDEKYVVSLVSGTDRKKQIRVDDKAASSIAEYYGRFPCFMIAPADIRILVDSSVERRRLMDKTLSRVDKAYLAHLMDYNKLLKQRNAVFKNHHRSGSINSLVIEAIDEKMVAPAHYICQKRQSYIEEIAPIFSDYYGIISNQSETLDIIYHTSIEGRSFREILRQNFEKDRAAGKTTEGIHRDDLVIMIRGQNVKKIASQGQLKSAIISLKLAQVSWVRREKKMTPVLLLDDIFDKLDVERVEQLMQLALDSLEAQIFISDTEIDKLKPILDKLRPGKYNHLKVQNGQIIQ